MITLASGFGVRPFIATAFGAGCGGITNFFLGRSWIFESRRATRRSQAARYALTSAVGLCLNSAGEYLGHDLLGLGYVLARAIVAVAVSLAWNFPMQRHFVFAHDSCFGDHS